MVKSGHAQTVADGQGKRGWGVATNAAFTANAQYHGTHTHTDTHTRGISIR